VSLAFWACAAPATHSAPAAHSAAVSLLVMEKASGYD
jgi:hypothetical protein